MNGNMNLGKRVTALEKDGGAEIKKEISDLQVAVSTVQDAVASAQNDINALETKVNSGHAYSTEEKVVGTWVDGKPLYERTVYFGSGTLSNRVSVSFENMNIDKIMVISGTFEDTTEGQLSIPVSIDGTFYVGFYCNRSSIMLTFRNDFNGRISNAYAVIQYTKTTDNLPI